MECMTTRGPQPLLERREGAQGDDRQPRTGCPPNQARQIYLPYTMLTCLRKPSAEYYGMRGISTSQKDKDGKSGLPGGIQTFSIRKRRIFSDLHGRVTACGGT